MGVDHRVVASGYGEEPIPGLAPRELAAEHALAKARDVAARAGIPDGGGVLGVDTTVVVDSDAFGKPDDREMANRMLGRLSGRPHVVATAVALVMAEKTHRFVDETTVTFRPLSQEQIDWYLDQGEWQGRAGAYAIQGSGAGLVERVEGDVTTVIGLPVARLLTVLEHVALAPWSTSG